ncbi:MAG: hypothetical protein R3E89_18865 [Thiolinea sp.]
MYPHWLWCLLLVPLLVLWVRWRQGPGSGRSGVVDPALAPFVLTGQERGRQLRGLWLMSLLRVLAILAMAGPAWEKRETPAFRKQSAVVAPLVVGLHVCAGCSSQPA